MLNNLYNLILYNHVKILHILSDEYTRITTPRQDVLFKKGYLSKRKPLIASTSTSSADPGASTSAPSTPSTQSTSPEHHAHTNGKYRCTKLILLFQITLSKIIWLIKKF